MENLRWGIHYMNGVLPIFETKMMSYRGSLLESNLFKACFISVSYCGTKISYIKSSFNKDISWYDYMYTSSVQWLLVTDQGAGYWQCLKSKVYFRQVSITEQVFVQWSTLRDVWRQTINHGIFILLIKRFRRQNPKPIFNISCYENVPLTTVYTFKSLESHLD